jgi:hypothetical protein
MLRFSSILVITFLALTVGQGAENDSASIHFNNKVIDFQPIYEADGDIPLSFEFTNSGNAPLVINRLIATGFSSSNFPKDSIYPGECAIINATINPFGRKGYFKKTINVFSNTSNSPDALIVKGEILGGSYKNSFKYNIGALSFKQAQINFGYIFKGQTITHFIPIHNTSDLPLKISFKEVPKQVTITKKFNTLDPKSTGLIEITYNTSNIEDWDFIINNIQVIVESDTINSGTLMITANIREDFSPLTNEDKTNAPKASIPLKIYNYDTITSGEKAHFEFPLYNNGKQDLKIRAVKPTCGCTSVMPVKNIIPPGDSTSIVVEFNSLGFTGLNKKGVTVITNDPINYKNFLWIIGYVE